jgi:hypothetical protein
MPGRTQVMRWRTPQDQHFGVATGKCSDATGPECQGPKGCAASRSPHATLFEVDSEGGTIIGYIDDIGILVISHKIEESNNQISRIHARMEDCARKTASVCDLDKYHLLHFAPDKAPASADGEGALTRTRHDGTTHTIHKRNAVSAWLSITS